MKKFEVGHEYFDTWACDSDSISIIKIVKRSEKMVTFERCGTTRRAKIYTDSHGEYIMPDHYSMACVYRAERELHPAEPEAEVVEAPAPAPVITGYTVSADLVALAFVKGLTGNMRQADFLTGVITGSQGVHKE